MSSVTSETGHAYRSQIPLDHLAKWLSNLDFATVEARLYCEHWQTAPKNVFASHPAHMRLDDWEQGRLFCPAFEVRWHRGGEVALLLLLTEENVLPLCRELAVWEIAGTYPYVCPTRLLLVGAYYDTRGGFFADASIPHEFRYPVDTTGLQTSARAHAVLQGKHYGRSGKVLLTRFTRFGIERGQQRQEGGRGQ